MKVNIVVPFYNVEPYLAQFMDSLVNQTFQDFDIVAVDDKSIDDSLGILEQYKGLFGDRLKIVINDMKMGPGGTRNVGLDNLPGEGQFVLFADADDYLETTYLEKMLATAEAAHADMVICGSDRFSENPEHYSKGEMISNPEEVISNITGCKELAYMNTFLWNRLFRREVLGKLQFANMDRWEDTLFLFQVLPRVKRVKFVNEVLYHYRQRSDSDSMTGGLTEEKYISALKKFQESILSFRNQKEDYCIVRDSFEVQVFVRCAVGGVCRISLKNMKAAGRYVRQMRVYLDETIPGWEKNPYLIVRGFVHRNLKENAIMIAALLYKWRLFIVFVWAYWLLECVLRKDVRY